ncbi:MAG: hypothetical protein K0R38_3735 [Polyangiaceae bacterium]|jgi:hypothetical protein|nr:hypothetical protein [Polyangiaceae bacterium]
MRSVFALLTAVYLLAGLTRANLARAQASDASTRDDTAPTPSLSVTREQGAEACPDTAELSEHVARLRGQSATGAQSAYHVTFSREGGVYRAAIRMGGAGSVRVLRDRGQTCASLEQATALTVALLLDSDAHDLTVEEHDREPEPEPPAAPMPPPPTLPWRAPPEPRSTVRMALSFGGAGLFGVVQTAAPAALADAGLFVNRFHTGVGVLWMPTQKVDLAPGQLRETLLSGVARTCYAALHRRELRFELCTGIYAGLLRVEARGYTRSDVVKRAWLAVPLELSLSTAASPVGVELGATVLLPVRQSDFAIDNLGTAYESWPVGMLLSLRAVGSWLL